MLTWDSKFLFLHLCAGLRGSVLVSNEHGVPAKFQWLARHGVDTDVFYMMHPRGSASLLHTRVVTQGLK